ncbi:CBN-GLB-1 protein [Caenorhabditis brenneri]|uniref:Globin n=2 Tax=Caenorhabditis TaxID=6237 RepID=Q27430_CAERE|nr:globin [Caenorhabditis remanei]AAA89171.1 globin [Caenorhabditis remanei]AAB38545.1 globin [Caenorhabditis remanei]AAB38546.1 globin [Caenorhabditis remanei]EGT56763.1 CBN-GLB-1 protein [Caenorhabditis brenneri]
MSMSRQEIQDLCVKSLEEKMVGTEAKNVDNGNGFYQYFFTNFPDLRVYFKGAEKYTAEDVKKSERFDKQGQRILLACHLIANVYTNEEVFKAYVRETVNRHRIYKMDPALWMAFFTVFTGYLGSTGSLTDQQKAAWMALGKEFNAECQEHLKNSNLPYVH